MHWLPLTEAVDRVLAGQIVNATAVAGVLRPRRDRRRQAVPALGRTVARPSVGIRGPPGGL